MDNEALRDLYPSLTDEELKEAEENLHRYFACAMRIAGEADAAPVDKSKRPDTMNERSIGSLE